MVDGQRVKSSHEGLGSPDGRDLKLRKGIKMDSLEILYDGGKNIGQGVWAIRSKFSYPYVLIY
jgi:hypothetical protein